MRIEISSAAQFLVDLVRLNTSATPLTEEQLEIFKTNVTDILQRHYTNHWFPDKPFKGSGYRCIRINGKMDPLIARAGFMMGLAVSFLRSLFPSELTMWVDPREVSYRIGENGSICILYEGGEKTKKGEEVLPLPAPAPTEAAAAAKTPEKSVQQQQVPSAPSTPASQQAPSPPPALPQHHQLTPPPQQQQQQVHHHHHQHHHHHHFQQHHHHFSPSKSVVVSSPLQLSRPMSPVTPQHQNHHQQQVTAMQLSMIFMNKERELKCKESLQRGLEVARPLQMDRLFVSS
ncbi:protein BTG1-like [Macrobrachium rosenbergii]|uniref:protein BTG1-like n=1 Tax=Macrobrachium rosenbergii TaxID=79674 RepID=UPI0034D5E888